MATTKKYTAAYRLFHFRYPIYLPRQFLYGAEYLRKHGYHVTGDPELDAERLNEIDIVNQSAAGMAILKNEGAEITGDVFLKPEDTVSVYEDIQEHLQDWERAIFRGIHINELPPLEDFRKLEAVALALYETAKFYEPQEIQSSAIRDRIMDMNRRRGGVAVSNALRQRLLDKEGNLKPYISIADRIERKVLGGEVWQ